MCRDHSRTVRHFAPGESPVDNGAANRERLFDSIGQKLSSEIEKFQQFLARRRHRSRCPRSAEVYLSRTSLLLIQLELPTREFGHRVLRQASCERFDQTPIHRQSENIRYQPCLDKYSNLKFSHRVVEMMSENFFHRSLRNFLRTTVSFAH
jgi:hypothetical protein